MAQSLTVLQAPLMAEAEGAKQKLVSKADKDAATTRETCTFLPLQEQPKWSGSLKLAGFGATLGAAVPVGYCTGVVNSPAVVSGSKSHCQF